MVSATVEVAAADKGEEELRDPGAVETVVAAMLDLSAPGRTG